jgi:hypothetical protein
MATFTFTKTINANDLRQAVAIAEQLRRAADVVETQPTIATPFTKVDAYGNTLYQWTVA